MSIKLGPLDIAKMEATRFTLDGLTSPRDTGWCWHNFEAAKCPHKECGYRDLLAALAAADPRST